MQKFEYSLETYRSSDAGTVAALLEKEYSIKSVIDIGCGLGGWLSIFQQKGCEVLGVDNHYILQEEKIYVDRKFIVAHDLSTAYTPSKKYDLAICLEVAEHIPAENSEMLIDSLVASSDLILFSAAIPFQGGQGHVNEQWPEYWIEKFQKRGYYPDDIVRPQIWSDVTIQWWYRQNILLFKKGSSTDKRDAASYNLVHPHLYLAAKNELKSVIEGREGFRLALSIFWRTITRRIGFRK